MPGAPAHEQGCASEDLLIAVAQAPKGGEIEVEARQRAELAALGAQMRAFTLKLVYA